MIPPTGKLRVSYRDQRKYNDEEGDMDAHSEIRIATYFGVEVEVLVQMDHCSLIRHNGREFVVETADLKKRMSFAKAA